MEMNMDVVELNGKKYVLAESVQSLVKAETFEGLEYCIVRTYSAGVFAGYIDVKAIVNRCGTVLTARRLWRWAGAASLSQLAVDGTSKPNDCKFPCPVDEIHLTEIIEVIPCTAKAKTSIEEVAVWKV